MPTYVQSLCYFVLGCICVFVLLYLCIRHLGILLDQYLFKNIAFTQASRVQTFGTFAHFDEKQCVKIHFQALEDTGRGAKIVGSMQAHHHC